MIEPKQSREVTSFPKEKIKILLLENVNPSAVTTLQAAGYENVERLEKAISQEALKERISDYQVVGIRSKTKLTADILQEGKKLLAVGAFCIGTDQIDLEQAMRQGVAVFNSPYSSTRSVAELTIGSTIHLLRRVSEKAFGAERHEWQKTHQNSYEVRNKTLGIVGYGRIGTQVSILAEGLGMNVIYYDVEPKLTLGNARACDSMEELLNEADVVTLHVPKDPSTYHMIGEQELSQMKQGSCLINYARGNIIVAQDVADAIKSGHLSGAAVDVFEEEPAKRGEAFSTPLQGLPNVILTPHIGGATEEAQQNIGIDTANKIINFLDEGTTFGSVSIPELNLPSQKHTHRLLHMHWNHPGVLSEINNRLNELNVNVTGQYLKTNDQIGYVVTDLRATDFNDTQRALEALKGIDHTIRARSLY